MRYARWHESLETGDVEIDGQHRALYELVNDLNASSVLGSGREAENAALQRIVEYASQHFGAEEALMVRFDYPEFEGHRAIHAEFAQAADNLVIEHAAGRGARIPELAAFMEEWLRTHIGEFDQPMVTFVRANPSHTQGM